MDPIAELIARITAGAGKWPMPSEEAVRRQIRTWRAFLESDHDDLKLAAGWTGKRDYKVDPLAELIADTWADHLYGEDLVVEPSDEADVAALEYVLEGNDDLTADLHAAERRNVGEGEQWGRVYVDREVADVPLLEWHSRDAVIPHYVGKRLLAVALVTELDTPKGVGKAARFRHLEIHVDNAVEHVLFRGTKNLVGQTVPLETHPALVELATTLGAAGGKGQRWEHGLPMLMFRVVNGRGQDAKLKVGISDFRRIADQLLDLNEAATIGPENARLTAKRRVVVPEGSLKQPVIQTGDLVDNGDGTFRKAGVDAQFDAGEDVFVVSNLDAELGKDPAGVYKVLEYSFDAEALIVYKRDLVETALTRIGLTPQYAGIQTGEAPGVLSGTAYKLKLIPTTKAGRGKWRPWGRALPNAICLLARVDALDEELGGFGRNWTDNVVVPPAVTIPASLPPDEVEDAQVEATLVGAGIRSRYTSIQRQHPSWTDEQIKDELKRIDDDKPPAPLGLPGFGGAA